MSRTKASYTEEEIDNIQALGESLGLDQAAAMLLGQAQEAFASGQDEEAKLLRSIAKRIKAMADARYIHPDVWAKPQTEGGRGTR